MKVPPEKDKTVTKRTVAGAAGGMKGVDYEDDRRPTAQEVAGAATIAASSRARALLKDSKVLESAIPLAKGNDDAERAKHVVINDPSQTTMEDEIHAQEQAKRNKKKRQHAIARDRMAVDKDAPELIRKRKWEQEAEEEEEDSPPEPEPDVLDFDSLIAARAAPVRARIAPDEKRREPGDPSLTDPDEMHRALGAPLPYAKHAMILGEAFRKATGATRTEAIEYLAKLFVAPSDRAFGRLALKEFGPASGIIDVYPLEVLEHVLLKYPGFLPKVGFGRFFSNLPEGQMKTLFTDTATPILLEYPEELKVRGFALAGGGRPGYTFEPDLEPGKYRLHIQTSGRYTLLVSALNRGGYTLIDRLVVKVRAKTVKDLGLPDETSYYPERDAKKVAAWPIPTPKPIDPTELLLAEPGEEKSAFSTGERLSLQQQDAIKGRESKIIADDPLPPMEATLGAEDAELLKLAVEMVLGEAESLAETADDPLDQTQRIEMPEFDLEEETPDDPAEITEEHAPIQEEDGGESGDFDR